MATKINLNGRGERGKSGACCFHSFLNSLQSPGLCSQAVLLFALASHFLVWLLRTINAIPEQRELVRKMWVSARSEWQRGSEAGVGLEEPFNRCDFRALGQIQHWPWLSVNAWGLIQAPLCEPICKPAVNSKDFFAYTIVTQAFKTWSRKLHASSIAAESLGELAPQPEPKIDVCSEFWKQSSYRTCFKF